MGGVVEGEGGDFCSTAEDGAEIDGGESGLGLYVENVDDAVGAGSNQLGALVDEEELWGR